jgi:type II secretory pathway component PulF
MTRYRYISVGPDGKRRTGQFDAAGEQEARRTVSANGELLVELKEAGQRDWFRLEHSRTPSPLAAANFALELSGLLGAGAPLRKALEIQSGGAGASSRLAYSVLAHIDNGGSLSSALRQQGGGAELLAEFAAAGEAGAGLDRLLASGGQFLKARQDAISRIGNALAYPLFIAVLGLVAMSVITVYVAPVLAPTLREAGKGGFVLWLAAIGTWVQDHLTPIALALAVAFGLAFLLSRQAGIRRSTAGLIWSLPVFGPIARDIGVGQSCEVLSALLQAGRPLETSLRFASAVSGPVLAGVYTGISEQIRDGATASSAFLSAKYLPAEVRRLALLGEKSSAFATSMGQAGQICHDRAMRKIDRLAALIGPALVITMGGAIALLMLTILGTLSSIGDTAL